MIQLHLRDVRDLSKYEKHKELETDNQKENVEKIIESLKNDYEWVREVLLIERDNYESLLLEPIKNDKCKETIISKNIFKNSKLLESKKQEVKMK